ncbi:gliding motility-associated C-terminal domain-containing protein [Galbibacter sp. PAP.153]|uniref:DUF7507 domain-containing protein n=1 Tax=Galbibacter sp. PAP.153 TaxID=3104623 RepID=UPI00300AA9AA
MGSIINQSLQNLTDSEQTVIYTITAESIINPSCSSSFDISVVVPVCSSIDIKKSSDVNSIELAGDMINYTFTVTNTGNANQTNVVLSDPLIGGVILGPESGDNNNNNILETGEVWVYTASYSVLQEDIDSNGNPIQESGIIQNIAKVTSDEIPLGESDTNEVIINTNPSFTVTKTQSDGSNPVTTAGEVLGYSIEVTNTGNVSLTHLEINDILPDGSVGTVNFNSGDVDDDGEVDPGEIWTYIGKYTVSQSDIDAGLDLVNTVYVSSDQTAEVLEDTAVTGIVQHADVITQKRTLDIGQLSYEPGGSVAYTIEVHNNGPSAAKNVNIIDIAPEGTTIGSWTAEVVDGEVILSDTFGEGNLNQNLPILPNNATVRYTVIVDIPINYQDDLVNTVTVTSPTDDPDPNCPECVTPPLEPDLMADIVTTKTVREDYLEGFIAGQPVIYDITITNNGPNAAEDVNVTDIAPQGTIIDSWSAEVIQGNIVLPNFNGSGDLDEIIPEFPNQAIVVYTVVVSVPGDYDSDLTNVVDVFSSTEDPDPTCDDCSVTISPQQPEMALIKTVHLNDTNNNGLPDVGESLTYMFNVTNTGNVIIKGIEIVDEMPGIQMMGEPFDLEPGETNSTSYRGEYMLTEKDLQNGSISNQAVAKGNGPLGDEIEDISDHTSRSGDNPTVFDIEQGCTLEVFNAITPNADGVNDFFKIQGIECYPNNTLEIYDRWGILVYKKNNYDNQSNVFSGYSDGRSTIEREESLPTGTYFYVLKYQIGQSNMKSKSGYIYLNQ